MAAAEGAKVIPFPETHTIRNVRQAVALLDQWQAHAERLEALYALACVRNDMSEALLADALAELERVRGLLE